MNSLDKWYEMQEDKQQKITEAYLQKKGFNYNYLDNVWQNDTRISIYKSDNGYVVQIDETEIKEVRYIDDFEELYRVIL